jgi:hypothetical protein
MSDKFLTEKEIILAKLSAKTKDIEKLKKKLEEAFLKYAHLESTLSSDE